MPGFSGLRFRSKICVFRNGIGSGLVVIQRFVHVAKSRSKVNCVRPLRIFPCFCCTTVIVLMSLSSFQVIPLLSNLESKCMSLRAPSFAMMVKLMSIHSRVFCHSHWECYCFNLRASTINYMQTGLSLPCTTEERTSVHAHLERSYDRRIPIIYIYESMDGLQSKVVTMG